MECAAGPSAVEPEDESFFHRPQPAEERPSSSMSSSTTATIPTPAKSDRSVTSRKRKKVRRRTFPTKLVYGRNKTCQTSTSSSDGDSANESANLHTVFGLKLGCSRNPILSYRSNSGLSSGESEGSKRKKLRSDTVLSPKRVRATLRRSAPYQTTAMKNARLQPRRAAKSGTSVNVDSQIIWTRSAFYANSKTKRGTSRSSYANSTTASNSMDSTKSETNCSVLPVNKTHRASCSTSTTCFSKFGSKPKAEHSCKKAHASNVHSSIQSQLVPQILPTSRAEALRAPLPANLSEDQSVASSGNLANLEISMSTLSGNFSSSQGDTMASSLSVSLPDPQEYFGSDDEGSSDREIGELCYEFS